MTSTSSMSLQSSGWLLAIQMQTPYNAANQRRVCRVDSNGNGSLGELFAQQHSASHAGLKAQSPLVR
jgi:hypothetical protein